MNNNENIIENFTGSLRLENGKIGISVSLTEIQMLAVQDVLGLEVYDLGSRVYDVRIYDDEDLLDYVRKINNNLDEQTLFSFPCKIGDKVYSIYSDDEDGSFIEEMTVTEVSTHRIWADKRFDYEYSDIGKTIFLTREEAEKRL